MTTSTGVFLAPPDKKKHAYSMEPIVLGHNEASVRWQSSSFYTSNKTKWYHRAPLAHSVSQEGCRGTNSARRLKIIYTIEIHAQDMTTPSATFFPKLDYSFPLQFPA